MLCGLQLCLPREQYHHHALQRPNAVLVIRSVNLERLAFPTGVLAVMIPSRSANSLGHECLLFCGRSYAAKPYGGNGAGAALGRSRDCSDFPSGMALRGGAASGRASRVCGKTL